MVDSDGVVPPCGHVTLLQKDRTSVGQTFGGSRAILQAGLCPLKQHLAL